MNYFTPKFWLGMTATPDKRDDKEAGRNIYEIFHYQIAYEIRLQQAMEENMLCPFHYFGINDIFMSEENSIYWEPWGTEEQLLCPFLLHRRGD